MRGGYLRDVAGLVSLFTPDYYAECVEAFDGDTDEHAFLDFCIQEMNENLAYLALCAWPNAIGREHAWSALSFPLEQKWADKVSIIDDVLYLSATFTDKDAFKEYRDHEYASETADGCVVYFFVPVSDYRWFRFELEVHEGVESVMVFGEAEGTPRGEITDEMLAKGKFYSDSANTPSKRWVSPEMAGLRRSHPDEALFEVDEDPVSELVEEFGRQFSQEEAEQILEGFRGDVKRASRLYRDLTEGYAGFMTVEDLIKAGKD
jgi:hypothetical protein